MALGPLLLREKRHDLACALVLRGAAAWAWSDSSRGSRSCSAHRRCVHSPASRSAPSACCCRCTSPSRTACSRSSPAMSSPGYRPWRPLWLLGAFWALALAHLALELRARLPLAVGAGPAAARVDDDAAVALVAARLAQPGCWRCCSSGWRGCRSRSRCIRRRSIAYLQTGDVLARPRAGARVVHRLLRQRAGRDGDARDAGPFGSPAADAGGRRGSRSSRSSWSR